MSNTAIKVENLSKIYRLGEIGTGTISRDMERWFKTKVLKQEDPFLKIGETNDRAHKGASDVVYSLRDINFEIQQGDAVGIIGRNGAGKSTLLKILSRVTTPTTGKISIQGRVASLLEVGTGFHPELTGRENIYLNGAILGMRKREIDHKLDEIIDFSGVERYIDTPVKRYSSGMYVRLAFAVAAHLESEILIVDEVLAVGDSDFQNKCLGKMDEISRFDQRTLLFVSHNLAAMNNLCRSAVLLGNGQLIEKGQTRDIIKIYNKFSLATSAKEIVHENIKINNFSINRGNVIFVGDDFHIEFCIKNDANIIRDSIFNFEIRNEDGFYITSLGNEFLNKRLEIHPNSNVNISLVARRFSLKPGKYFINFYYYDMQLRSEIYYKDYSTFAIEETDYYNTGKFPRKLEHGVVFFKPEINYF